MVTLLGLCTNKVTFTGARRLLGEYSRAWGGDMEGDCGDMKGEGMVSLTYAGRIYDWIDGGWHSAGVNRTSYINTNVMGPKGYTHRQDKGNMTGYMRCKGKTKGKTRRRATRRATRWATRRAT
jgi:hypothetical protein